VKVLQQNLANTHRELLKISLASGAVIFLSLWGHLTITAMILVENKFTQINTIKEITVFHGSGFYKNYKNKTVSALFARL
jgi:hypothetical protein